MPKDFSHQDLRGKSFNGQDLTGADFSHADIRGANFKGAILKGANFSHVKGGLIRGSYQRLMLIIIPIMSAISGYFMAFSGLGIALVVRMGLYVLTVYTDARLFFLTISYFVLCALITIVLIRKGKYNIFNISIVAVAISAGVGIGLVAIIRSGVGLGIGALAGAAVVGIAVTIALTGVVAGSVGVVGSGVGIGAVGASLVGVGLGAYPIAMVGSLLIGVDETGGVDASGTVMISTALSTIILLILSIYIAYRISKEDEQFASYRKFGIMISSFGGTNFQDAYLSGVNFTGAVLKSCYFNGVKSLIHTCFYKAQNLKVANFSSTILEKRAVRELLSTGNGNNQSYAGLNLKGAYLVGADLSGADLTEADLIGATLENANLRNANLSRIQALGVEFRGADLTGACLESWNIDSTTQLDSAKADYVYLLGNKLERRPASGNFGEGEFAKLFNEVLDTVDFIFRNGIDWQAFMISFDNLREKIRVESDNAEISIQSIANKGDGVFVVKVNVPLDADKAEFHSTLTREYDTQLKLIEEKYQAQLAGKEELITAYRHEVVHYRRQSIDMLRIIQEQPQIHITAIEKISMIDQSRKIHIEGDVGNATVIAGDENEVSG